MVQASNDAENLSPSLYRELEALKIRIAFAELEEEEYAELEDMPAEYSEEAQRRTLTEMQRRLERKSRKQFVRRTVPRTLRLLAALLSLAFLGLTTATATVHSIRLRVLDFISKIEEQYSTMSLDVNENDKPQPPEGWKGKYFPLYIPDEFSLIRVDSDFNSVFFRADDGRIFEFAERKSGDYSNFDTLNGEASNYSINGADAIVTIVEDQVNIAWSIEETYFILDFKGDQDEAEMIAESVRLIE